MSDRESRYISTKHSNADMDDLTERLSRDLRASIRSIGSYKLYSDSWKAMTATFGRLDAISSMEAALPSAKTGLGNVNYNSGGNGNGTLWESEEQSLRFLLEDGKLNSCLRNMIEFKQDQYRELETTVSSSSSAKAIENIELGIKFEKGLGSILYHAWAHVEALQTTDVIQLLSHIEAVLSHAVDNPGYIRSLRDNRLLESAQETLVLNYLLHIVSSVEALGEDRVMPAIREKQLLVKVLQLTTAACDFWSLHAFSSACHVVGCIVDTEDFATYRDRHIKEKDDVMVVLDFDAICGKRLDGLKKEAPKIARPVMEFLGKIKRMNTNNSRK